MVWDETPLYTYGMAFDIFGLVQYEVLQSEVIYEKIGTRCCRLVRKPEHVLELGQYRQTCEFNTRDRSWIFESCHQPLRLEYHYILLYSKSMSMNKETRDFHAHHPTTCSLLHLLHLATSIFPSLRWQRSRHQHLWPLYIS